MDMDTQAGHVHTQRQGHRHGYTGTQGTHMDTGTHTGKGTHMDTHRHRGTHMDTLLSGGDYWAYLKLILRGTYRETRGARS